MIKVPCEKCDYREVGCHSRCKRYKNFRKLKDKENDTRKREAYKYDEHF